MSDLTRHGTLPAQEVLPLLDGSQKSAELFGLTVKLRHLALRSFYSHGTVCSKCGFKGTFFAVEVVQGTPRLHLYGTTKDGQEVRMFHRYRGVHATQARKDHTPQNTEVVCHACKGEGRSEENSLRTKGEGGTYQEAEGEEA